jgi:uncharacterized membrane protein YczE
MPLLKKLILLVIAFLCNAMAIGLFILVNFGLDSISVFAAGLANVFHTTVGMASLGFYFAVIFAVFFISRRYISIATLISLVVVGPSIDLFTKLFSHVVTADSVMTVRVVFFVLAYLCVAFAIALYLAINLGIAAPDMIPVLVSDKARLQFRWCKIVFDITLIAIGIFLGGSFGIGTIVLGFVMGPTIQYFRKNIEKRVGK